MKVYIPEEINNSLLTAKEGTVLYGTLNIEHKVASVTDILHIPPSHKPDITDNNKAFGETRLVLATIGNTNGEIPFHLEREHTVEWFYKSGEKTEIIVYQKGDFFKRTPFNIEALNHLKEKKLLIVGVGSVGAPIGVELAKSGIGEIIALDKDILEIHNCMRHTLGTSFVGWPKPIAFAENLKEHAPNCMCIPIFGDLFQGDRSSLRNLFQENKPTHILAVTDSLHIQYLCQMLALYYQLPLMSVWCDNNAVEGEIFMWEPGQAKAWKPGRPERGCYACMRDPNETTITRSSSFDYSSDDPGSYGGEPALGTFINRINNIASIFLTAWMLKDYEGQSNLASILDKYYEGKGLQYIRLGGPYPFEINGQITAKKPWAVEWYRVQKKKDCPFCGNLEELEKNLYPTSKSDASDYESWENYNRSS